MSDVRNPPFLHSLRFRYGLGLLAIVGFFGYLLWDDYKVPILEYGLPLLLMALCMGGHWLMHGKHRQGPHDD